jgi:hypothetical protein
MGRSYFKCPTIGKTDIHPGPGYINWWENVVTPKKKAARQQDKRDIKKEINGYFTNI